MTFKVDENLPKDAAELMRRHSFDTATVQEETLAGAEDEVIARAIQREHRILITLDLDFSDIRTYPPEHNPGIIVLRPKTQDKVAIMALIQRLVRVLENHRPDQALWIVEHDRIRFRPSR